MCRLKKFCGLFNLRTGCVIIFVTKLFITLSALSFTTINQNDKFSVSIPGVVCGVILGLGVWVLLLIGTVENNDVVVLVNLIFVILFLLAKLIFFTFLISYVGVLGASHAPSTWDPMSTLWYVLILIFLLFDIGLDIYFSVVIASFYQELRYSGSAPGPPIPGLL